MSNDHDDSCLCPFCFDPFSEFGEWAEGKGYNLDDLEQLSAAVEAYWSER
jgi:hypothetical protein